MPRITNPFGGGNTGVNAPPSYPTPLVPPSFGPINTETGWRNTWAQIVAGNFSPNNYQGLLFYEQGTGYAEFYNTDGEGGLSLLRAQPNWRPTWTQIIRGRFHRQDFMGLLFYDREAGFAQVYDTDGTGGIQKLKDYTDWRTSWDNIVTLRIPGSDFSALLFYDQAAGHGEIHTCDGHGGFNTILQFDDWRTTWTHVVSDFFTTGEVFFYEGSTGYAEVWQLVENADRSHSFNFVAGAGGLPAATDIIPGNFGTADTSVLFYDKPTGTGTFVFYDPGAPGGPGTINTKAFDGTGPETYTNWPTTLDIIVPGDFWGSDTEDYKFQNGFTDLLFYDRAAGTGQFYFHEPFDSVYVQDFEGFSIPDSVAQGQTIQFYVNSRVGAYQISIYLQGVTQRLMTTIRDVLPIPEPFPIGRQDYRDGPSWPAAAQFQIPADWPSGLYLARIEQPSLIIGPPIGPVSGAEERRVALGNAPVAPPYDIPFVVRTANPGTQSKILFMIPDCTYQAYNFWGGRSLYGFWSRGVGVWNLGSTSGEFDNHQTVRAFRVSLNRPYHDVFGYPKFQNWETPFIQWLVRMGIEVEMCTGTDVHNDQVEKLATGAAGMLSNYHMIVSVGHDEYWSKEMLDNVESFVSEGGNAAFFSANVCWWQIRFDDDPVRGGFSRQVCYKDERFDPINTQYGNPILTTVNWYDKPVCRAETSLTGVSYYGAINFSALYWVLQPDHWVFAGLGYSKSTRFGLYKAPNGLPASVVGYEADRFQPSQGSCKPQSPSNFVQLAYVPGFDSNNNIDPTLNSATMGIFQSGKGQVFTAGTVGWSYGLNGTATWTDMDQITLNVFNRFK